MDVSDQSHDSVVVTAHLSHAEVVVQLAGVPRNILVADHVDDPPVLDDVVAVGEGRGKVEILLDQEDREALLLQPADHPADLLDDDRRQTLGRLVEQQQGRAGAQHPADRQHLLLAAGELGALAAAALPQVREDRIDLVDRHAARQYHRREQQVFLDVEAGEDAALFRTIGDAEAGDAVGGEADKLAAAKDHRALPLRHDPHDRPQGRRLAGAVAARASVTTSPCADGKAHSVQDVGFAVPGVQFLDAQQLLRRRPPRQAWPVPRYASMTSGFCETAP